MSKVTASLLAAAKALNRRHAAMCEIDEEDSWNVSSADFIEDAEATPEAAGFNSMLAAMSALDPHLDSIVCYAGTMDEYVPNRLVVQARAALKQATTGDAK